MYASGVKSKTASYKQCVVIEDVITGYNVEAIIYQRTTVSGTQVDTQKAKSYIMAIDLLSYHNLILGTFEQSVWAIQAPFGVGDLRGDDARFTFWNALTRTDNNLKVDFQIQETTTSGGSTFVTVAGPKEVGTGGFIDLAVGEGAIKIKAMHHAVDGQTTTDTFVSATEHLNEDAEIDFTTTNTLVALVGSMYDENSYPAELFIYTSDAVSLRMFTTMVSVVLPCLVSLYLMM